MAQGLHICNVENGYIFIVDPNNNNNQPLGESTVVYKTEQECRKAADDFARLVKTHRLRKVDGKFVKIKEGYTADKIKCFWHCYFNENGIEVFQRKRKRYMSKNNCKKGIESIFRIISEQ